MIDRDIPLERARAWERAVQSIAPPADKLAKRLQDLESHSSLMVQMEELHEFVLQEASSIIATRDCFLKSARTKIVHTQFDALSAAYSHQYSSVTKASKGVSKREACLQKLEQQHADAEEEDDVQEMLQLAEKIRELRAEC